VLLNVNTCMEMKGIQKHISQTNTTRRKILYIIMDKSVDCKIETAKFG